MYCPNCGKENPGQPKFCRSCGLRMELISQAMATEMSEIQDGGNSMEPASREQRIWQNPMAYGLLLVMLGIVVAIFAQKVLSDKTVADIGTLVSLVGVGLLGLKGVLLVVHQSQSKSAAASRALLSEKPTIHVPPALPSAEALSVTEHTTRQLEASLEKTADSARKTQPT